jgi:hypothetical protein
MMWERVYTVNEFWDGPRLGVADVGGLPHIYQSPFDSVLQDFSDFFLVSPIDAELLDLVLEDWGIWTRWCTAFEAGVTTQETHPALAEERAEHEEITSLIGKRLAVNPTTSRRVTAEFRIVRPGWSGLEVQWSGDDDAT